MMDTEQLVFTPRPKRELQAEAEKLPDDTARLQFWIEARHQYATYSPRLWSWRKVPVIGLNELHIGTGAPPFVKIDAPAESHAYYKNIEAEIRRLRETPAAPPAASRIDSGKGNRHAKNREWLLKACREEEERQESQNKAVKEVARRYAGKFGITISANNIKQHYWPYRDE